MKFEELLDKTLGEIIEEYSIACNYECGFIYGIIPNNIITSVNETYNINEYSESFIIDSIIDMELLSDSEKEILDMDRIDEIMTNLGISKNRYL